VRRRSRWLVLTAVLVLSWWLREHLPGIAAAPADSSAVASENRSDELGDGGCRKICDGPLPDGCVAVPTTEYLRIYEADFMFQHMLLRAKSLGFGADLHCSIRCGRPDGSAVYSASLVDPTEKRALLVQSRGDIRDPLGSILIGARGIRRDLMFGTWTLRFDVGDLWHAPIQFLDETGKLLSPGVSRLPDTAGAGRALGSFERLCG